MAQAPAPHAHRCQPSAAVPSGTLFVRLPILRGEFTDPPPVTWDSTKDDVLWNILSGAAKTEIDWNEL
ncbi:hypothetical protein K4K54_002088, partial [Colletotrichum sp. SAR 10_86]